MELADNPKLEVYEGKVDSGKISETNGFQYTTKPESFVIDIDSLSNSNQEISHNSRIIRNFSRKGLIRGSNKMSHDNAVDTGDSISPSPLASSVVVGGLSTLEKQGVIGLGSRDQMGGSNGSSGGIVQSHQIAMTTGHAVERSSSTRRNSFKRSPQGSWYLHPRKIFLFCATLSFVGTIFLIYSAYSYGRMVRLEGNDQFDY